MFVPFETLSPSARIWIYQSNKKFNSLQRDILSESLSTFSQTWMTHGTPMKASFTLAFDHFLILAADEEIAAASGCSIDDSVRTIKNISQSLGFDLFDRTHIAFKKNDTIDLIPATDLKKALSEGRWSGETLTFNNLLTTKAQLSDWIVPASTTWLKRYFSKETVAN